MSATTVPTAIPPVPPLSAQIKSAAETLAAQVSAGAFEGADPGAVTELRDLSMVMGGWSDRVLTDEGHMALIRKVLAKAGLDGVLLPPAPTREGILQRLLGWLLARFRSA